jgi:hypothetical protein
MSLIYNADALKLLQANAKRHDDITQFKYDKYPRMHHLDDVVEKIYEELTALDAASGGGGTNALVGTYTNGYIPRWNSTSNTLESGSIQDNGTSIGIGVSANSGITCNIVATGDSQLSVLRVQGITSPNKTGDYTIHNNYIMFSGATAKVTGVLSANINQIYIMDGLTLPSEAIGSNNKVFYYDTVNNLTKAVGVSSYINSNPSATIVEGIAYEIKQPSSYGNITTWYGLKSEGSDNDNTNYHIYLAAHQDGAAKWGIYQAGANDKNYFAGAMQFDTAAAAVGYVWKATDVDGNGDWATITKTDVGLSNVENTALSTWSGSTNITTLGTIATGTWNGSVITNAYLDTGIADNKIVEIDQGSGASDNDYAKFTTNGLEGRSYSEVKTDLSLNNVENISLSTWAGSSNITTLGTIGTGTWNGTAIIGTYINESTVDHDQLLNFNANEHFTQANITTVGTIGTGVWQGTAITDTYIASAATWNAKADISATPANNQVAVWTNGTTIEGDSSLTWNTAALTVTDGTDFTEIRDRFIMSKSESDDANLYLYGYGSGSNSGEIYLAGSRGTIASPTATQSGDTLGEIGIFGAVPGLRQGARILIQATENYVDTSNYGTKFVIQTAKNGTATAATRYTIDGDGNHSFIGDVKYSQQVYQDGGIYNAGSSGASFTPNFINGNLQKITMSNASITIANPTNVQNGAVYTMCFVQDATGGRTIATWGSDFNWGDASAPDFTGGAAGKKHYVTFVVNGTTLDAIYSGVIH